MTGEQTRLDVEVANERGKLLAEEDRGICRYAPPTTCNLRVLLLVTLCGINQKNFDDTPGDWQAAYRPNLVFFSQNAGFSICSFNDANPFFAPKKVCRRQKKLGDAQCLASAAQCCQPHPLAQTRTRRDSNRRTTLQRFCRSAAYGLKPASEGRRQSPTPLVAKK